MIDTLFAYNDWANAQILELADGLNDEQLDQPREMGFGSLRATLFHIWEAEHLWLERWQKYPKSIYPNDAAKGSLAQIAERLREVSSRRRVLIEAARFTSWSESIQFRDRQNNEWDHRLDDMLLHVANHGIHHRAQALHFLKRLGRKLSGGIDYLFFRIAYPSTPLISDFIDLMRQYGLETATAEGSQVQLNKGLIRSYFGYHDWAIAQLMPLIEQLDGDSLHRSMEIGVGSIHQTLAHLRDAEQWWLGIWKGSEAQFSKYNSAESLPELATSWQTIVRERNEVIQALDENSAARVVIANPGNLRIPFRVIESMIQLCGHGTHHRAQVINMLRRVGVASPSLDYMVWLRKTKTA